MPAGILRRRIARALRLKGPLRPSYQGRYDNSRRKATFTRGKSVLTKTINFKAPESLFRRMENVCDQLRVQRGVLIREALLLMIEGLEEEIAADPIGAAIKVGDEIEKVPENKVKHPDGHYILFQDANPHGKTAEMQAQKKKAQERKDRLT